MANLHPQLPLPFQIHEQKHFDQFFAAPNDPCVSVLQSIQEPVVLIWGPSGSGKSHLLQAACHWAAEQNLSTAFVPLAEAVAYDPEALQGLDQYQRVCLDDVQAALGHPEWELALFDLFNRIRAAEHQLILSADHPPKALPCQLPDLTSRLGWGPVLALQPLSDETRMALLQARASRLGIELKSNVARYLIEHAPRDPQSLSVLLAQLDQASLAAGRKLTIPFVRSLLSELPFNSGSKSL